MKKQNQPKTPLSLRLTFEERAIIEKQAAGLSLNAYIRSCLFDGKPSPRKTRGKFPVKDHQLLGQILGQLGASEISANIETLCDACRSGSLPVTPETQNALFQASADIREIRAMLMKGLGVRP